MRDSVLMDVLTDVLINGLIVLVVGVGTGVAVLVDLEADVVTSSLIDVEFAVSLSYVVDSTGDGWVEVAVDRRVDWLIGTLARLSTGVIIGIARGIRVNVLVTMNINVWAAVVTELDFTTSASLEE